MNETLLRIQHNNVMIQELLWVSPTILDREAHFIDLEHSSGLITRFSYN